MTDTAIRIEALSKRYRIGPSQASYKTLRDTIAGSVTAPFRRLRPAPPGATSNGDNTIWALKDASFEVKHGEVVGIIGRNGAGKSTLLKILSRVTEPTTGYADIEGRIGSLLEVGTGFHPELTGRENTYLNGAILGMKRAEIKRKFDEIIDFAEIAKFVDTPVKHYSTGMYLRLAFSVAAHLNAELLIVDEVLAVGDAMFQRKCLGKMREVGKSGRAVLFVSHDLNAILRLTSRSVVLEQGKVCFVGPTNEAINAYISQHEVRGGDLTTRLDREGDGVIRMESVSYYDSKGRSIDSVRAGDPITIAIAYSTEKEHLQAEELALDMRVRDVLGNSITTLSTRFSNLKVEGSLGRNGSLVCHIPSFYLVEHVYTLDLWLAYRGVCSDYVERAGEIRVAAADYFGTGHAPVKPKHGATMIRHEWTARLN